ncbi:FKBP-type peptidyl-prolyl cis-trans isomerase [Pseudomonas entomophila]|uniref:FKBP-type peptidyl-prolyl cis-trans isomerase n=1 Tax=Pseudomonas entomophila TaxID=312306 RepID=UPI0015E316ED|nr:FKBP-type peptidyl-prolyl cis-trans isomerase [Pseudomonas entomophila]
MPRYPILALALCSGVCLAAPAEPGTRTDDLSYGVGVSLGQRLHAEVPDLQLDTLIEGLRQGYQGKPLRLEQSRIDAILQQHDEAMAIAAEAPSAASRQAAETRFMAEEHARPGVRELAQGVLYTELAAGTGEGPAAGGKVQVRYVGRLPDGSVFDQSQQPQWFALDSVIAGWRVALMQMKPGAKGRVVIPSAQAYGADGAGDLIPPDTPLVFNVELLAVKP